MASMQVVGSSSSTVQLSAHGTAQHSSELSSEPEQLDLSIPTDAWSPEARRVYDQLCTELTTENGWQKRPYLVDMAQSLDEPRLLTRCDREQTGRFFNYAFWINQREEKLRGVVEFGPYAQGPPSCAHGGATATIADACMGSVVWHTGRKAVTANLNVNYKNLVQLGVPHIMEAALDKEDGRKLFLTFSLTNAEHSQLCSTSTALFLMPRSKPKEEDSTPDAKRAPSSDYVFPAPGIEPKL
ncbi:acyl-coenzyme A thioesterase THEM4-like [Sycon ciliatum]|uniref:acyl-coenzyme A thioesterase THEM4-like n=1 Tax=Sycon ciliatum TaxID=27933 RepID=UPI0031F61404